MFQMSRATFYHLAKIIEDGIGDNKFKSEHKIRADKRQQKLGAKSLMNCVLVFRSGWYYLVPDTTSMSVDV